MIKNTAASNSALTRSEALSLIPETFTGGLPEKFVNNVLGWGVPEDELHSRLPDGTFKMLTIDIDFGSKCSLGCPHCFQSNQVAYKVNKGLSWEQTMSVIDQAKDLGLKYVKILGAGEPFENVKFLDFLVELDKRDIHTAIFTKGHVLGSDELTKEYFGERGIKTADELVSILYSLKTSILLGFNSFDEEIQNTSVGVGARHRLSNYTQLRDRALSLLVREGFNNYHAGIPTRLAFVVAPFKPENIDGVFDIYKWGCKRNIYVAACPTTSSGNGHKELKREAKKDFDDYMDVVKQTYVDIYNWGIENGVIKMNDFMRHKVSLYPGAHACNQVAGGVYIKLNGEVYLCPGNDNSHFLVNPDVTKAPLRDIWMGSLNYKLASDNQFNYQCMARKDSFFGGHPGFYDDVFNTVMYVHENKRLFESVV